MMDITCGDCGARFRLDAALMKGAKGGRVRCRRCGGHIVVLLPEDPPVRSVDDLLPMDTEVPSAEPKGVASHAPEEGAAAGADLLGGIRPEPIPPPPEETPVPPQMPGTVYSRLEDMFAESLSPEEYPAGENPPEETVAPEPGRKVPTRRAPSMPKVLVISVLWILLLAGGTYYFGATKSLREGLGRFVPGSGATRPASVAEKPSYDIRDVKTHVDNSSAGGSLFVIRGSVANVGNIPSAGIRIQAILMGQDNVALAEKTAFAGNVLDEASLRQMDRVGIDAAMSNRFGEGDVNKEIPPGKSLPFLVVFFNPPGGIEVVMVMAVDARQ